MTNANWNLAEEDKLLTQQCSVHLHDGTVKVLSSLTLSGQACHVWGSWRAVWMPDEVSVRTSLGTTLRVAATENPPDLTFDVKTSNKFWGRQSVLRSTSAAHLRGICNLEEATRPERTTPITVVAGPPQTCNPPMGPMRLKTGDLRNNGDSRVLDGGPFELLYPVWMWAPPDTHRSNGRCGPALEGVPTDFAGSVRYLGGQVQYFLRARWISRVPGNALVPSRWGPSTARLQVHASPAHAAGLLCPLGAPPALCLQVNKDRNSTSTPHGCSRMNDWEVWGGIAPQIQGLLVNASHPPPPGRM